MTEYVTVKVRREEREGARELSATVAREGWGALGLERTDAPTIGALVAEGLAALRARLRPGRRRA